MTDYGPAVGGNAIGYGNVCLLWMWESVSGDATSRNIPCAYFN